MRVTAEELLRFKNAAPFQPFEMMLADGRALPVPHPDFIGVREAEELVQVYGSDEELETIDLLLAVSPRFPIKKAASSRPK